MNARLNIVDETFAPIDPIKARLCQRYLQEFADATPGIHNATIATADGFEVAQIQNPSLSASRMAAMSSSLHALGNAVVQEAMLARCQNIIIEADAGKILLMAIPGLDDNLVLNVIADSDMLLGQLLWACGKCCERISAGLK